MTLTTTIRSDKKFNEMDYRGACKIEVKTDEKTESVSFFDGEPEDANISRDFCDVTTIDSLVIAAYEAGARGESLSVIEQGSDDI